MKRLLELRKKIKRKKPHFIRQESHKRMKLEKSWRRPKGLHSKMRLRLKGYHKHVSHGYGSPKEVKGLHESGLKMVLVHSEKDAGKIDKSRECAIIGRTVGMRKRILLLNKLRENGIKIVGIKDVDAYINHFEEKQKAEKEKRKAKGKGKKKEKEKPKDKLAEKILTEEEKKEGEKKEKDKLLTKRV